MIRHVVDGRGGASVSKRDDHERGCRGADVAGRLAKRGLNGTCVIAVALPENLSGPAIDSLAMSNPGRTPTVVVGKNDNYSIDGSG